MASMQTPGPVQRDAHVPSAPHSHDHGDSRLRARLARTYARVRGHRQHLMRLLGLALLVYGAIGLTATLISFGLVREAFAGARDVGSFADSKQRAQRGLRSISVILNDASTSSSNMSTSFKQSQASLVTASQVASDVADSFRVIATITSVQVGGVPMLGQVAEPFTNSSERLDTLADDLQRTSVAVGTNVEDMQRLSNDFSRMRTEVDDLSQTVARLPSDPLSGADAQRLELALTAMLAWIGLQALASSIAGLTLLLFPLIRGDLPVLDG